MAITNSTNVPMIKNTGDFLIFFIVSIENSQLAQVFRRVTCVRTSYPGLQPVFTEQRLKLHFRLI